MTLEEREKTIKFAVDTVNHRIPVIVGTGGNCTKSAIEMTKFAEKAGVKSGDIIVKIGNTKLASMSDLTKCLYTYKSGDSTSLVVNRDGKEVKLNVAF